jgi:hypothetical protein
MNRPEPHPGVDHADGADPGPGPVQHGLHNGSGGERLAERATFFCAARAAEGLTQRVLPHQDPGTHLSNVKRDHIVAHDGAFALGKTLPVQPQRHAGDSDTVQRDVGLGARTPLRHLFVLHVRSFDRSAPTLPS